MPAVAYYNVKDVRPTLKHYQGKDIAKEYAKIEEEQKKRAIEEWERVHPTAIHGAGSGLLSSMFGSVSSVSWPFDRGRSADNQPGRSRPDRPMTFIEQKRAEAQRNYQEEQKYWRDNAAEFTK